MQIQFDLINTLVSAFCLTLAIYFWNEKRKQNIYLAELEIHNKDLIRRKNAVFNYISSEAFNSTEVFTKTPNSQCSLTWILSQALVAERVAIHKILREAGDSAICNADVFTAINYCHTKHEIRYPTDMFGIYNLRPIINDDIKRIALQNGFKLKPQENGEQDLNPYVYDFAKKLIAIARI